MKKLKSILLIDDDSICSWINKTLLEQIDVVDHIECIFDGNSALDFLQKVCSENEKVAVNCPDLILLDLNMPGLDGFQVMDELMKMKMGEWLIHDRIIVLTTSISKKDFEKAGHYNIHNYLVKPLTEAKVREAVEGFINRNSENNVRINKKAGFNEHKPDRAAAERPGQNIASEKSSKQSKEQ